MTVLLKYLLKYAVVSLSWHPPPPTPTPPPPTTSWLRQCSLNESTVWCPQASSSVWLKHLCFLSRSIFKPFIFVDDVKLVPKAQSPCFGDNDPAKKEPRFLEKPDRRHELYKAHEWARAVIESDQVSLAPGPRRGARSVTGEARERLWSSSFSSSPACLLPEIQVPEALPRRLLLIFPASLLNPNETGPALVMVFQNSVGSGYPSFIYCLPRNNRNVGF